MIYNGISTIFTTEKEEVGVGRKEREREREEVSGVLYRVNGLGGV